MASTNADAALGVPFFLVVHFIPLVISHCIVCSRVSSGQLFQRELVIPSMSVCRGMSWRINFDLWVSLPI